MSGFWFKNGQGNVIINMKLCDSSQTTPNNKGLTGLSSASAGLILGTKADVEAAATAYTQASSQFQTIATIGTYVAPSAGDVRFQQIDATNMPGWYEIQLASARFAVAGAKFLGICFPAVAGLNLAQADLVIPLTDIDPYSRAAMFQSPMTEGYSVNGTSTPSTPEQALFELKSLQQNKAVIGNQLITYKLDGATVAMTFNLDSSSSPTKILRFS